MPTLSEGHALHDVSAGGLVHVPFIFVLSVRAHVRDLVAVRPEIAIFQVFADVVRLY